MSDQAISKGATYRTRGSDRMDKALFFTVFVLGAAGILGLKFYGLEQYQVTIWPVALMGVYAAYVFMFKRFYLREDQAADNFYYLGFLFTLTSLAHALVLFHEKGGPEPLISNFGIALATTIVGLFLRVLVNQFRQDIVEIERDARLELGEAASRLRSQLDHIVLDVNSFRRAMQQSIEEGMSEVAKKANEGVAHSTAEFATASAQILKKIDSSFDSHAQSSDRFSVLSGQIIQTLEDLLGRIEGIEAPADLITKGLSPAVEEISEAAKAVRRRANAEGKQVEHVSQMIEQAVRASEQIDSRLAAVSDHLGDLEHAAIRIAELRQILADGLEPVRAQIESHREMLDQLEQSAKQRALDATASFNKAITRQDEVLRAFASRAEAASDRVFAPLSEGAREQADALSAIARESQQVLDLVKAHNAALEGELERSRRMTIQVHAGLATMIQVMTEELGGTAKNP